MNPRELVACAEAAMMTAKARGKNQIVAFGDGAVERPDSPSGSRDVRSIAHLKMLQSLSGKLNRLNDVREIGMVIANELRSLIDYHNCRVFVVDGDDVVPVAFRGDLGDLAISKLGLKQFDEDDVRLLEVLAGQASVALENARLYEAERREAESAKALLEFGRELASAQGLDEILDRVVSLSAAILGTTRTSVWLQDPATGELVPRAISGYTEEERPRVLGWRFPRDVVERALAPKEPFAFDSSELERWIRDMAIEVGTALGLDPTALKRLELGALFHDIGKIGIPATILSKPGRLTAEERALMQTHPELGERIIAPIERLEDVRPIVRSCHEHWDGSGYPDGKRGEEIPLEARIILVCDAFHAMTTDRPYRKRLSTAEALRRLRQGAGSQFDPRVVDVYLRVLDDRARRAA